MAKICYPWMIYAEYADGTNVTVGGNDEEDCMYKICRLMDKHGDCTYYTGVTDEDYDSGEYIGRDNFIYD